MSDDRQSWPILSANAIGEQQSVVCHAKIGRFCGNMANLFFDISQQTSFTLLWRMFTVRDEHLLQLFVLFVTL